MKLNLTKPLVIFDLETTGLDLVKDRVIQISYIKVYPDGKEERGDELINPEKHIEPIITQLTGISDEDVKDKPTFKQRASSSMLVPSSVRWSAETWHRHINSTVAGRWRKTSRPTVPIRILRPPIAS